jgi:hypothetical protein
MFDEMTATSSRYAMGADAEHERLMPGKRVI